MSKTILAEVNGWTPIIDALAKDHGLLTAAVFGRIWRYCQGEKGVCTASLETTASDLGINKATVMRHAKELLEHGYLKDLTPDARNVPHIYADTGKASMTVKIEGVAESNSNNQTVADSNTSVAESNATVAESKLKKQGKKEVKKEKERLVIPESINTPEFVLALEEFITHREQLKKPMTEIAIARLIKKLSKYPVNTAIAMLDQSMENGWQGVFEVKGQNGKLSGRGASWAQPESADQSSDDWQAEYERTKIKEQARVKKLFEDHKRKLAEGAKSGNPD